MLAAAILAILLGLAGSWWSWHRSRAVDPGTDKLPFELAAPGSLPASPAARSFYAKGQKALARFKAEEAKSLFQQAIAAEPGFPLAHSALAEALDQLGYKAEAGKQAQQAEKLAIHLPREDQLLVKARSFQLNGKLDRAIASYQALFEPHPENVEFGLALAKAQIGANQGKAALETLERMRPHGTAKPDPRLDLAEAKAAGQISDFDGQQKAASRALAEGEGSSLLMARALVLRGMARSELGDPSAAKADFERAKELYTEGADKRGMAEVLYTTANALYHQGKLEEARQRYQEARDTYHELGDRAGEGDMLFNLASVAGEQGKLAAAQKGFEEMLRLSQEIGDRQKEATASGNIGQLLCQQGKLVEATQQLANSRAIYQELGDRQGQATQLRNQGDVLADQLELPLAEARYKEALALATAIGDQSRVADVNMALGELLANRGDFAAAEAHYKQALTLFQQLGDEVGATDVQFRPGKAADRAGAPFPGRGVSAAGFERISGRVRRRGRGPAGPDRSGSAGVAKGAKRHRAGGTACDRHAGAQDARPGGARGGARAGGGG